MNKVNYAATMSLPLLEVWSFVEDINNWAPMVKGYQEHEVINEKEAIWTIKGDLGIFSRVTKFHARGWRVTKTIVLRLLGGGLTNQQTDM